MPVIPSPAREPAVRPRTMRECPAVADRGLRWPGRCPAGRRAAGAALLTAGALAVAALAPAALVPSVAGAAGAFSAARPGAGPPPGWRVWTFQRIAVRTRYELIGQAGTVVLRAESRAGASGLLRPLAADPRRTPALAWRWQATALPRGADLRRRAGDDCAARLFVLFEGKTALAYAWATGLPAGTELPNAYTRRVRTLVVDSGSAGLGRWRAHRRDLVRDYRRAFGADPPPIEAVALMTDADDTRSHAAALYGDIALLPGSP